MAQVFNLREPKFHEHVDLVFISSCDNFEHLQMILGVFGRQSIQVISFNSWKDAMDKALDNWRPDILGLLIGKFPCINDSRLCTALAAAGGHGDDMLFGWIAREICNRSGPNIMRGDGSVFYQLCAGGLLWAVHILVEVFRITTADLRADHCRAAVIACEHGQLAMVKWLFEHFHLKVDDVGAWGPLIDSRMPPTAESVRQVLAWLHLKK
jgi:hypothetical protein